VIAEKAAGIPEPVATAESAANKPLVEQSKIDEYKEAVLGSLQGGASRVRRCASNRLPASYIPAIARANRLEIEKSPTQKREALGSRLKRDSKQIAVLEKIKLFILKDPSASSEDLQNVDYFFQFELTPNEENLIAMRVYQTSFSPEASHYWTDQVDFCH
jgi:hypothetical protein